MFRLCGNGTQACLIVHVCAPQDIAAVALKYNLDGLIVSNTTIERPGACVCGGVPWCAERGGRPGARGGARRNLQSTQGLRRGARALRDCGAGGMH